MCHVSYNLHAIHLALSIYGIA